MTLVQRVLCFGNTLQGDDGVGSYIAQALRQGCGSKDVEVLDLGTNGWALSGLLAEDCTGAVLVDAWRSDGPAGRVVVHRTGQTFIAETRNRVSHGVDLRFALQAAQAELGVLPPITIVMITIVDIVKFWIGLSPAVEQAIPRAVAEITRLLEEGAATA